MKIRKILITFLILAAIATDSAFACGPGYVTPVFDNERAPDTPYREFASGNLGIIKPTYRRSVLLAAYRYLTGGGFSDPEQKALIEFWEAEINNKSYDNSDELGTAVKAWVASRKSVLGADEKTPEIYVERAWGGYEFFPNCTKNAFETAARTLSDRSTSHGSDDRHVKLWVKAQDQVFNNCANGKSIPDAPNAEMPEWLQKDRAYQIAAAEFYALDYESARRRFREIAEDSQSPWQETAEYLVGRTLIREASLSNNKARSETLYIEADQALQLVQSKGGKYSSDAERLLGVVKYRLRPSDRMHELAQSVAYQGGYNFRQDLIDYTWLLDKYEKETLDAEEKRKAEESARTNPPENPAPSEAPTPTPDPSRLTLYIYLDEKSVQIDVSVDATDEQVIAEAERAVGKPLDKEQREALKAQRQAAYSSRFNDSRESGYQGGYWGEEKMSISLLPEPIRQDEISSWLFIYQMSGPEAYAYALGRFRETNSDLWLMTAISKADATSSELDFVLDKARRLPETSAAFATAAFHIARIELGRGKTADVRTMIDSLLDSPSSMPISSRNQFLKMRLGLSQTLPEFLKYALRKPYAFDFDGSIGSIDEHLAERKSWWSPDSFPGTSREQYDKELEKEFDRYRIYADEKTLDEDSLAIFNRYFPTDAMIPAARSEILPKHMRQRLVIAIWTRAVLLDNETAARSIVPDLLALMPELADDMKPFLAAATPLARRRAGLLVLMRNPILTPAIDGGFGADNVATDWDSDNWWCSWFFDSENEDPAAIPAAPAFLTKAQTAAAKVERQRLLDIGDAPKFFGESALEWARLAPADKRVPEALYIAWSSNGWTKYGCGNGPEFQDTIADVLRKRYPASDWTKKLDEVKEEQ